MLPFSGGHSWHRGVLFSESLGLSDVLRFTHSGLSQLWQNDYCGQVEGGCMVWCMMMHVWCVMMYVWCMNVWWCRWCMMIMDFICIQKKVEEACDYSARNYDRKNLDGDMTIVFCGCVNLICSLHPLDMLCVYCAVSLYMWYRNVDSRP